MKAAVMDTQVLDCEAPHPTGEASALDHFRHTLPPKPRCANDPTTDCRIRAKDKAVGYRLIEPNTAGLIRWLVFDLDWPGSYLGWEDCHVPPPSIVCRNPENNHAHLLYGLFAPVARTNAARLKPLFFTEMVERSLRTALRADRAYAGTLVKNPLHPYWEPWEVEPTLYSLGELADNLTLIPRNSRAANDDIAGLGRNCETFERLRQYAYTAIREFWGPGGEERFYAHLLEEAGNIQGEFMTPLPFGEVRGIARSTSRWVWKRFTPETWQDYVDRTHTPEIQAKRGARKGKKRREELMPQVHAMVAEGHTQQFIADKLGVPKQTVSDWLKRS